MICEDTIRALNRNHIQAEFVKDRKTLLEMLRREIPEGSTVAAGSSETLDQLKIRAWLQEGNFDFVNCEAGVENRRENILKSFQADFYLSSVAAVTEQGELFLVDGTGNRTAAFSFGPRHIIVIASVKKITPTMAEAEKRLKEKTASLCAGRRKKYGLPCYKTGACKNCHLDDRMCCYYLKIGFVRDPKRFHVYLIGEDVGF